MRRYPNVPRTIPVSTVAGLFCAALLALVFAASAFAQEAQPSEAPAITTKKVDPASLWDRYSFRLEAQGGVPPYRWQIVSGTLPHNLQLRDFGEITGEVKERGEFEFTVQATDRTGESVKKNFTITVQTPLTATWLRKLEIHGQRADGAIQVSNNTGRNFDLTFDALAVNEIGRATAIGYQHFTLPKNTDKMGIPFGDNLSRGTYVVHLDVVGEEPVSGMIFRVHLVTPLVVITQGP